MIERLLGRLLRGRHAGETRLISAIWVCRRVPPRLG